MPTNDLTYTVTGVFTNTKIEIAAHLPALTGDSYTFHQIHDISHKDGAVITNALLIHMKLDSGADGALSWNGTDPDITIPTITPSTIIPNTFSHGFNWDADDVFIVLFHEPFNEDLVKDIQTKVRARYEQVKLAGPFSATWSKKNVMDTEEWDGPVVKPRKAGMTIIAK